MEVDPSAYECHPLKTVDDLLLWRSAAHAGPFRPSPRRQRFRKNSHLGDVMYIHDMQGGYLDDRFAEGNANNGAFRFYHWHLVDYFVYFSHALVTVPPLQWIEVAHTNGGWRPLVVLLALWRQLCSLCRRPRARHLHHRVGGRPGGAGGPAPVEAEVGGGGGPLDGDRTHPALRGVAGEHRERRAQRSAPAREAASAR